jgi:hypothetical protein
VSTVKSHRGDNFGPEKKNVRVVGMGVCLPLRVTAVTIEAAAAGRGVTSVVQRLGSWHLRGKFFRVLVSCVFRTLESALSAVLSSIASGSSDSTLTNIVDEIFRTSKSTSVISTQHPYDANKQTHGHNDNFGPEKKKCESSGDVGVSTVKSHRGDNKQTNKRIEAAAAGRGVTSVVQRLGSWHTRGKFSRVLVFGVFCVLESTVYPA